MPKVIDGSIIIPETVVFIPKAHPAYPLWKKWCNDNFYTVCGHFDELPENAEHLFLISCTEIIGPLLRSRFNVVCVIHESDLPKGRGWSPLAWQILEGKNNITVSAIGCADRVDSGDIYAQEVLSLDGSELADEINSKLFETKCALVKKIAQGDYSPKAQEGDATYYKRRTPADSELDPKKTIAEQFNLLRICEPRFPAFFNHRGFKYTVTLRKEPV
jgi:methionyl-tRNA formyltransferase